MDITGYHAGPTFTGALVKEAGTRPKDKGQSGSKNIKGTVEKCKNTQATQGNWFGATIYKLFL